MYTAPISPMSGKAYAYIFSFRTRTHNILPSTLLPRVRTFVQGDSLAHRLQVTELGLRNLLGCWHFAATKVSLEIHMPVEEAFREILGFWVCGLGFLKVPFFPTGFWAGLN